MIFDLIKDVADVLEALPIEHPRRHIVRLLDEGIRRDAHFIYRHPTTLFQCLWNTCWWYDCREAVTHYETSTGVSIDQRSFQGDGESMSTLMRMWRSRKEELQPGFIWVRSLRPPPVPLGGDLNAPVSLNGHVGEIWGADFSSDGQLVATGGASDLTIRMWDTHTGREVSVLRGHTGQVWWVQFLKQSSRLLSASGDGTLRLWNAVSGDELLKMTGSAQRRVGFRRNDSEFERDAIQDQLFCCAVASNEHWCASGGHGGTVRIWDLERGHEQQHIKICNGTISAIAISPDSSRIAVACLDRPSGSVKVFDTGTGKELWAIKESSPTCVRWCCHTDMLFISSRTHGVIRSFDPQSGALRTEYRGHDAGVECLALSPDGSQLASASTDMTARVWDVKSTQELSCLRGHVATVGSVAFSADGLRIVTASEDGTAIVWQTAGNQRLPFLKQHGKPLLFLHFSPNGKRLFTSDSQWDMSTLIPVANALGANAVSKDGKVLARITSGECLEVLRELPNPRTVFKFARQTEQFRSVTFSRCSTLVALGTGHQGDAVVRVFDVRNGRLHWTGRRSGTGPAVALSFSPNRKYIAMASANGQLMIWRVGQHLPKFVINCFPYSPQTAFAQWWEQNSAVVEQLTDIAFSSKGDRIVAQAHRGNGPSVQVWSVRRAYWGLFRRLLSVPWTILRLFLSSSRIPDILIRWRNGTTDVSAIASGSRVFSVVPMSTKIETGFHAAVDDHVTAWFDEDAVAWWNTALRPIAAHPSGRTWAGASGPYLSVICLEGNVDGIIAYGRALSKMKRRLKVPAISESCTIDG